MHPARYTNDPRRETVPERSCGVRAPATQNPGGVRKLPAADPTTASYERDRILARARRATSDPARDEQFSVWKIVPAARENVTCVGSLPPSAFISFADLASQMANRGGRIAVWMPGLPASPQQNVSPPLGMLHTGDQIVAIRSLPTVLVVLRRQSFKNRLHLVAILISVVVPLMQDQPKLEAWIGTANENAVTVAQRYRFIESRMLVTVEYRPHLIVFFERVFASTAASNESLGPGSLDGSLGDGIGHSDARGDFHRDQRACTGALDRLEVGRLRVLALAVQKEPSLRLALRPAAPQIWRWAFPTPVMPCH